MIFLQTAAWLATLGVLLTYAKGGRVFDWANALGALPLCTAAVALHAYPQALLSGTFGLIGAVHLFRARKRRPVHSTPDPYLELMIQEQEDMERFNGYWDARPLFGTDPYTVDL